MNNQQGFYSHHMAQRQESQAALRISGDDLKPAEITELLGCQPSYARAKGEQTIGSKTNRVYTTKTGIWSLEATQSQPADFDAQIAEILQKLPSDLTIWAAIGQKYEIDLYCGLFMVESNEGISMSAASLTALGLRGIAFELDIYDPCDD